MYEHNQDWKSFQPPRLKIERAKSMPKYYKQAFQGIKIEDVYHDWWSLKIDEVTEVMNLLKSKWGNFQIVYLQKREGIKVPMN
jgi:hypothetical protein